MKNSWSISTKVIGETINTETIILNLETGIYYSCEHTGSLIWMLLEQGYSKKDITAHFQPKQDLGAKIAHFIAQLEVEDLIIEQKEKATEKPILQNQVIFKTPILEKHTDMKEFLELDPIHEVYHIEQKA